jgi:hypothetical protein
MGWPYSSRILLGLSLVAAAFAFACLIGFLLWSMPGARLSWSAPPSFSGSLQNGRTARGPLPGLQSASHCSHRGINVANAQPNGQGLANVNPIFTWVRLAQRIPVRIRIDEVSEGVVLAAGMTATVQINPQLRTLPEWAPAAMRRLRYWTTIAT